MGSARGLLGNLPPIKTAIIVALGAAAAPMLLAKLKIDTKLPSKVQPDGKLSPVGVGVQALVGALAVGMILKLAGQKKLAGAAALGAVAIPIAGYLMAMKTFNVAGTDYDFGNGSIGADYDFGNEGMSGTDYTMPQLSGTDYTMPMLGADDDEVPGFNS